jgi:cyclohexadieny/prephenate dehydrogenase
VPDTLGPPLAAPLIDRLAIIGLGLIGSSIARAARRRNAARIIVAADRAADVCARVAELAIADEVAPTLAEAARGADLVILCVPVGADAAVAEEIAPHLKPAAIVSDVGSVKSAVIAAVGPRLPPGVALIPAHPVAGTEQSGPDAGFATLFLHRWCILTPPDEADASALALVRAFWEALGSNVEVMTPAHHDLVLAITSHVPHLIAYNIVGTVADLEDATRSEVLKFSAGGFRDFTRIAASDPTMWRDVFLHNKEAVLEMLGRFNEDLTALQRMIRRGDGEGLFDLFTRTRAIRRGIVAQGQETAAPDFGRRAAEEATETPAKP